MARATLELLIGRLRLLLADFGGVDEAPLFSDDDLEGFLDETRTFSSGAPLWSEPDPDGQHREFAGPLYFEAGAMLYGSLGGSALSPQIADPAGGRWRFEAGFDPPIRVVGARFDLYEAAARALSAWIARIKLEFDLAAGSVGDSWHRSQKIQHLERLRDDYRSRSQAGGTVGTARIARSDWRGW